MTWLKRVKKSLRSDELFGKWDTDDAKGFGIMMRSCIEFKPNGTGNFESWENSDNGYEFKGDFKWERIGNKKIAIQEIGKLKKEEIHYKMEIEKGREKLSNHDMQERNEAVYGFWNFAQQMCRSNSKK